MSTAARSSSTAARSLSWSHGVFTLESLGGMLGPTLFVLSDGRTVAPFHIAPWFSEPGAAELPGILQRLRGEWPCVPFGAAPDRIEAPGWPQPVAGGEPDPNPHGFSSNHEWHWIESAPDELALAIDYPAHHPVSRLTRRLRGVDGRPALEFSLTVEVRRTVTLPIGLHPVFRLNSQPGSMELDVTARQAATFPDDVDPSSIFVANRMLADWRRVPLRTGGEIDPSHLPLPHRTEDLLQLLGTVGHAALTNRPENYRVALSWNREHFPDLLLWFSNRGRSHFPWNGRHLALGVEPVSAALDLGTQVSGADNPISRAGSRTGWSFTPSEPFETRYSVSVDSLA